MRRIFSIVLVVAFLVAISVTQVSASNNKCQQACEPANCAGNICPPGCCAR